MKATIHFDSRRNYSGALLNRLLVGVQLEWPADRAVGELPPGVGLSLRANDTTEHERRGEKIIAAVLPLEPEEAA